LDKIVDEIKTKLEVKTMINTSEIIREAINEYYNLVFNILECECDEYNGFTCGIHYHRQLAKKARQVLNRQKWEQKGRKVPKV